MKKGVYLFLFIILIANSLALTTNETTPSSPNPIATYMQQEVSSTAFKLLGAPEVLTNERLIVYLLMILVCFIIIADILSTINLFDKKWITFAISLIIVLLGVYSGTAYTFMTSILELGLKSAYLTAITIPIAIGVFILYLVVRIIIKAKKMNKGINPDQAEEFADNLKTLVKIEKIKMKAEGIK